MLTEIQISNNMYHLKKQIEQIESELHEFTDLPNQIPELITSANLLRLNNFLMKSDDKITKGEAIRIDGDGGLIVKNKDKINKVIAGDIIHLAK